MLDIRTMAVWLSVTLTASTYPLRRSAFRLDHLDVVALGRTQFTGDGEESFLQNLFQIAPRFHTLRSSLTILLGPLSLDSTPHRFAGMISSSLVKLAQRLSRS